MSAPRADLLFGGVEHRSKRERWADFYLVSPPPTVLSNPEEYWRIRRELRAEIERYGYVRGEGES